MSTWTIPVIVKDVKATPRPQTPAPGFPDRRFGLIGVLTIMTTNTSGAYQGQMLFTKPPNFFAGKVYPIATQYITGSPVITITIPQAASDCQQNFRQNGIYNPPANPPNPNNPPNPALFDTASVNANGVFTPGNLSLPDFTLKGTWDNSQNIITNGEIWLPYRFLWAIWGNTPTQSQTPWNNINLSLANGQALSTNNAVFSLDMDGYVTIDWGVNGMELIPIQQYITLVVNLSGITLAANQGIALNISCAASSAPLSLLISANNTTWTTVPAGFDASVKQQCFYIAPNLIPSTNPFYLKIQNNTAANVTVSAAQLMY